MPFKTTGMEGQIQRFKAADGRMKIALEPVVAEGVHRIGQEAKANASFSSQIPGQEYETSSFLTGTVGFTEVGFPHRGKVFLFEGDGVAPEPFIAMVYGGPGESKGMTHPFLGPAVESQHEKFVAECTAAVHRALS